MTSPLVEKHEKTFIKLCAKNRDRSSLHKSREFTFNNGVIKRKVLNKSHCAAKACPLSKAKQLQWTFIAKTTDLIGLRQIHDISHIVKSQEHPLTIEGWSLGGLPPEILWLWIKQYERNQSSNKYLVLRVEYGTMTT